MYKETQMTVFDIDFPGIFQFRPHAHSLFASNYFNINFSKQVPFAVQMFKPPLETSVQLQQINCSNININVKLIFDCSFDVYWKDYWKY